MHTWLENQEMHGFNPETHFELIYALHSILLYKIVPFRLYINYWGPLSKNSQRRQNSSFVSIFNSKWNLLSEAVSQKVHHFREFSFLGFMMCPSFLCKFRCNFPSIMINNLFACWTFLSSYKKIKKQKTKKQTNKKSDSNQIQELWGPNARM